jgi:hypothetical protein
VLIESSPVLTIDPVQTVKQTRIIISRTFQKRDVLSVPQILQITITAKTSFREIEWFIDCLYYTHDCDESGGISVREFRLFASDFVKMIDKNCQIENPPAD